MRTVDRARGYIAKIPPALSGSGGHDRTFQVACILVQGFALSSEDAWTLLGEYNVRCQPPWSQIELRHKLKDALKAPLNRPLGYLLNRSGIAYASGMIRPFKGSSSQGPVSLDWLSRGVLAQSDPKPARAYPTVYNEDGMEVDEETGFPVFDGIICPF